MAKLLMLLIRVYQLTLSPLLGPCCRFEPSCSRYASACLEQHGALSGSWLALKRLLRCHPFHPGGYDPPPLVAGKKLAGKPTSHFVRNDDHQEMRAPAQTSGFGSISLPSPFGAAKSTRQLNGDGAPGAPPTHWLASGSSSCGRARH